MTEVDRQRLLALARAALVARVRRESPPAPPDHLNVVTAGAFVTVYCRGELRGCLGTLDPRERLAEAIARLGADVAEKDVRFAPLCVAELEAISLDVSVLTAPQVVTSLTEVVIGRDGLIVEQGARKGLLLPQVAVEHGWDRETFLAHTCLKARLPADAWRCGATIFRFEAEVFGENHGRIDRSQAESRDR
jgi:AmmeMemoRadiSam system protein A